jgi:hypothetical protein
MSTTKRHRNGARDLTSRFFFLSTDVWIDQLYGLIQLSRKAQLSLGTCKGTNHDRYWSCCRFEYVNIIINLLLLLFKSVLITEATIESLHRCMANGAHSVGCDIWGKLVLSSTWGLAIPTATVEKAAENHDGTWSSKQSTAPALLTSTSCPLRISSWRTLVVWFFKLLV